MKATGKQEPTQDDLAAELLPPMIGMDATMHDILSGPPMSLLDYLSAEAQSLIEEGQLLEFDKPISSLCNAMVEDLVQVFDSSFGFEMRHEAALHIVRTTLAWSLNTHAKGEWSLFSRRADGSDLRTDYRQTDPPLTEDELTHLPSIMYRAERAEDRMSALTTILESVEESLANLFLLQLKLAER